MSDCSSRAFKVPDKSELMGCPLCGAKPFMATIYCKDGRLAYAYKCMELGHVVDAGYEDTQESAREAWNTRYQPICQNVNPWGNDYLEAKLDLFTCSICGWDGIADPNESVEYCPGCGAKVVD